MPDLNTSANRIAKTLGSTVTTPPYAVTALALMNKNGTLGARVDRGGRVIGTTGDRTKTLTEDFDTNGVRDFTVLGIGGAAFATTTALVHHGYSAEGYIYGVANIGVQTTPPVAVAAGLDIQGVATGSIGTEIFTNFLGASGRPFIIGKDADFFFRTSITVADISGAAVLLAGFRKAGINNVTYTSYADYAAIGTIAGGVATGAINIATENDGSGSPTDTTDTWADGATKTFEVRVSASGVVTFLINGVAPTVPASQTFDSGDAVIPFVHFIQHADIAGAVTIGRWEVGYL